MNRQGNDVGTQYRSAMFPLNGDQQGEAEAAIDRAAKDQSGEIVTTIEEATTWYPAEEYHQDYWEGEGRGNPYCMAIIPPKLQKLKKGFADRLRENA